MFFKTAQRVTNYLGHFLLKNCRQQLSKIAQYGHTGLEGENIGNIDHRYLHEISLFWLSSFESDHDSRFCDCWETTKIFCSWNENFLAKILGILLESEKMSKRRSSLLFHFLSGIKQRFFYFLNIFLFLGSFQVKLFRAETWNLHRATTTATKMTFIWPKAVVMLTL